MAGMEVEYDVTTATSEDPDFPAENLAEGRRKGWRAARGAPRAALELKLASPCHLKSVRVGNQDSPVAVVVFAQGSAVERGSFVGSAPLQAGAEQRGNCVRLAANHLSAGMVFEFKVGSRDDMLKAIASQHEWVSLRLEVTPLVAAGGTPPESFGLKKLEVERTLTDGEKKQREAAVTAASQPRPTPQPSQPLQPLEQSQPPSNASRPAQPLQPPAAAAAKPAAAPAPVRPAPPSARMSLQCLAHPEGCNGCGPKCGKEGKGCPLFGRQQSVRLPRSSPPPHEAVRPLALSPTHTGLRVRQVLQRAGPMSRARPNALYWRCLGKGCGIVRWAEEAEGTVPAPAAPAPAPPASAGAAPAAGAAGSAAAGEASQVSLPDVDSDDEPSARPAHGKPAAERPAAAGKDEDDPLSRIRARVKAAALGGDWHPMPLQDHGGHARCRRALPQRRHARGATPRRGRKTRPASRLPAPPTSPRSPSRGSRRRALACRVRTRAA